MNWDMWITAGKMFIYLMISLGLLLTVLGYLSRPKRKSIKQPKQLNIGDTVRFEITDPVIIEQMELLAEKIDLNEELYIGYNNEAKYLDEKCRMTCDEQDVNAMQIKAAKYRLMANRIVNENNKIMKEREKLIRTYGHPTQIVKR